MDYKDIANRLRKWANGETCEDCPAKTDLAFCAADAIYDLLSKVEAKSHISRAQVEKVWGVGAWETVVDEGFVDTMGRQVFHLHCPVCDFFWREAGHKKYFRFCPACGAPMTDEAVEMVMERMEALHGQENS